MCSCVSPLKLYKVFDFSVLRGKMRKKKSSFTSDGIAYLMRLICDLRNQNSSRQSLRVSRYFISKHADKMLKKSFMARAFIDALHFTIKWKSFKLCTSWFVKIALENFFPKRSTYLTKYWRISLTLFYNLTKIYN